MSTETDSNFPVRQDTFKDVASTLPCHHQFCLGCILRWTQRNPVCPLCRGAIVTVRFSDHGEDDYLEIPITVPEELPDGSSQAERAPGSLDENSSHPPVVSPSSSPQGTVSPAEQEGSGLEFVGSVLPEVWAETFRQQQHLLESVRPWLHERLAGIYQGWWWVVDAIESSILHGLCIHGPNAGVLVEVLQPLLEEHTAPLVHDVISIIMGQHREEAQRLLPTEDENNGPEASSSSSSTSSSSSSSSSNSRISSSSNSRISSSSNSRSSSFSSNSCSCSSSSNSCSSSSSQQGTPNSSPTGSDEEEEAGASEASPCPGHQLHLLPG
ncbi:uncharacterized protein LOC111945296 [Cyanistes caeruleus]|uniref:uncharacterized protein LOC111945296 n=1 Tax=Cyanistes caeruleus TaxID=156563 RepID=UPI000CDA603C|nr:uncharacterized protein LOC111945296 [Cyanistes caeruleus]XP_023803753.1 uncharacterized protein LOC111945296 [Cyanistes caeruleus]